MGLFDFPRIHVWGTHRINPATGNNNSADPGLELTVTSDSEHVAARTRGMADEDFRGWITKRDQYGLLRCQWNYYGDYSFRLLDVKVTSVQMGLNRITTSHADDAAIGAGVFLNHAVVVDANPEGFNTTMMFAESFELRAPGAIASTDGVFVSRKPTTATTRWLNWFRNMSYWGHFNLPNVGVDGKFTSGGAGGASCTFQCGIPIRPEDVDPAGGAANAAAHRLLATGASPALSRMLEILRGGRAQGLLFRYNLYLTGPRISDTELADHFLAGRRTVNPAFGELIGTITPWYKGEPSTITMGRFLKPTKPFVNPNRPKKPPVLSPCVARVGDDAISIDTANCLPDDGPAGEKFDMGQVVLGIRAATDPGADPNDNTKKVTAIGALANDRTTYRRQGGIYDIPFAGLAPELVARIRGRQDELVLQAKAGVLLYEPEFMVASDCSCAYLDDLPPGVGWDDVAGQLRSDPVAARRGEVGLLLYRRGEPSVGAIPVEIEEWVCTPTGDPGDPKNDYIYPTLRGKTTVDFNGASAVLPLRPTPGPGLRIFRLVPPGLWPHPIGHETLAKLQLQEYCVDVRVLPYDDYSGIADDHLTWNLLYEKVFRYYYLILPAMNEYLDLRDPTIWETPTAAHYLLNMTDPAQWNHYNYMPRTRDLSKSRRELLVRFCSRVLGSQKGAPGPG